MDSLGPFLEVLIGGLLAGVLYSLVALGFVLIYKASGVFNFAQGAMVLLAGLALVRSLNFLVGHGFTYGMAVIGALLFIIGVAGVLTRRNIIVIFMSIELILNAANLNFIAFSRYLSETGNVNALAGQIFAVFVIVVAAAEAAIGLGIVIALYRNKETIWVDEIDLLKW